MTDSGSIFVQISDENLHRVRCVMDEVFGSENAIGVITFRKTSGLTSGFLAQNADYLLWYSKNREELKYNPLYIPKGADSDLAFYSYFQSHSGERGKFVDSLPDDSEAFSVGDLTSSHFYSLGQVPFEYEGEKYTSPKRFWTTSPDGMRRLAEAGRIFKSANSIRYVRYLNDFPTQPLTANWTDTITGQYSDPRVYVVQTGNKVIERCILMTSDPGDLVFDPTCGSGTTAYVAENWGRRWITCDTSRVALAIARQRILTAKFDAYEFADDALGVKGNFKYKTVPHITLKSIAQNPHLDPIFETFNPRLTALLQNLNEALADVSDETWRALKSKLAAIKKPSDAEKRRLDLPRFVVSPSGESTSDSPDGETTNLGANRTYSPDGDTTNLGLGGFGHWTVPFDVDDDYPDDLKRAVTEYRQLWREKMDAVNKTIADSAESETLYDKPIVRKNVVRVSGPFTVEAVQPPEMSLSAPQVLHPEIEEATGELPAFSVAQVQAKPPLETRNVEAYLDAMVERLRADGVTFLDNSKMRFVELSRASGGARAIHAVGRWVSAGQSDDNAQSVAVSFGPQYGPIGRKQVKQVMFDNMSYRHIVFAGFAFDADVTDIKGTQTVRVHYAAIRPDINPAMDGLLKEPTAAKSKAAAEKKAKSDAQLFSVFGQPRVQVHYLEDGWVQVEVEGIDVYSPATGEIAPTRKDKIAAWFLDCDYAPESAFCISQAFFPDQSAWEKIGKSLGNAIDVSSFGGWKSVPFRAGENQRIAVKAIDPRGNEVMKVEDLV